MGDKDTSQDIKINTLEVNYLNMTKQISDLDTKVEKGFENVLGELKCFKQEADKRYASKTSEYISYGFVALVMSAFVGGLLFIVWK